MTEIEGIASRWWKFSLWFSG